MKIRAWVLGGLLAAGCGSTSALVPDGTDYLVVQQGGRAWPMQDRALVRSVEEQLMKRGYDPGPIDGLADARAEEALARYQQDQGLPPSGVLDHETARSLGLSWRRVRADIRSARLEQF